MIKILHKGIQASFNLDPTKIAGSTEDAAKDPYIVGLVGGRLASQDANGVVQLSDGADQTTNVIGFIVNDAAGYYFENVPAVASGKCTLTVGNCIIVTDQVVSGLTFAPGEKLYAGTGGDVGLVTNVEPAAGAQVIGTADSVATPANPELQIIV